MYRSVMLQTLRYKDIPLTARMCMRIRGRNFSSSTCDDRYLFLIIISRPSLDGNTNRRGVPHRADQSVNLTIRGIRAYGPVCSVQPSIFEIVLIIDRLPCFVIIMNGIPYAPLYTSRRIFLICFSRSHYNKSRIARTVDRSRGKADVRSQETD